MKKIMQNKMWQKIILTAVTVLILFNVLNPTIVSAADSYGVLFAPIQSLTVGLGDAAMSAVNYVLGTNTPAVITISKTFWSTAINIGIGAVGVIAIGAEVLTGNFEMVIPTVKVFAGAAIASWATNKLGWQDVLGDSIEIPNFPVTPETIFSGKVPLLDVNIVNPLYKDSTVYHLQPVIASWYNTFRVIAIVGLLSVLVYIGIRIIISATADDKAKYKGMIKDWFVAFCLLFFMHYIMTFSTTIVEAVTYIFPINSWRTVITSPDGTPLSVSALKDKYGGDVDDDDKELLDWKTAGYLKANDSTYIYDGDDDDLVFNFMEYIRFRAQTSKWNEGDDILDRFSYTVMYVVLVIYTVMFLFLYLKRLVYIIFLTMISPLVALTYPLDKIKDGSAQGFNTWLREYMANLLLQPFHLFLYYVLIYSAQDLIMEHPIYAICVLGMMLPVEKLLRKMFGFDKSTTAGSLASGAFKGAAVVGGMNWLSRTIGGIGKKKSGGPAGGGNNPGGDSDNSQAKFRGEKFDPLAKLREKENQNTDAKDAKKANDTLGKAKNQDYKNILDQDNSHILDQDDSPLPDQDYKDYYGNSNSNLNLVDFNDADSIQNRMREIEDSNASFNGDPEWIDLNTKLGMLEAGKAKDSTFNRIDNDEDYKTAFGNQKNAEDDINFRWNDDDEAIVGKDELQDSLLHTEMGWFKGPKTEGGHFFGEKGTMKALAAAANEFGINKESVRDASHKVAGVATGAVLGGTAAMVGIGAGLASEDFSNIGKWGISAGAAGSIAGYSAGYKVAGMPSSSYKKLATNATNARDAYIKEKYGKEEMQKRINNRLNQQHMKNKKTQKMYADAFGKDWKKAMEASLTYRNKAGITNNKLIINSMKQMQKQGKQYDDEMGLSTARLAKNVNNRDDVRYAVEYMERNGIDKQKIKSMEKNIIEVKELDN